MILPDLKFEQRESETVLMRGDSSAAIGIVMPSGNPARPWLASIASGRETTLHLDYAQASAWLLGAYLTACAKTGYPVKIEA